MSGVARSLRDSSGRGLPQLSRSSDILADTYLQVIERALLREEPLVSRYADDFKVETESWEAATTGRPHAGAFRAAAAARRVRSSLDCPKRRLPAPNRGRLQAGHLRPPPRGTAESWRCRCRREPSSLAAGCDGSNTGRCAAESCLRRGAIGIRRPRSGTAPSALRVSCRAPTSPSPSAPTRRAPSKRGSTRRWTHLARDPRRHLLRFVNASSPARRIVRTTYVTLTPACSVRVPPPA